MCGLHGYLGYTQHLFAQGIMGLKNLYDAKPVSIYILGREAEGDLKRPFKGAASMFGGGFAFLLCRVSGCIVRLCASFLGRTCVRFLPFFLLGVVVDLVF